MSTPARLAMTSSAVACALTLSGCGTAPAAPPASTGQMQPGLTRTSEMYGPRCNEVPLSGPGSPASMALEPVGVAMDNTPLLTRLSRQLHLAGLEAQLNQPGAGFTVFAPAGSALEPLFFSGTLGQLDAAHGAGLRGLLGYHVVPRRYDARGLLAAGTVHTLEGAPLSISGNGLSLLVGDQKAHVVCGDIPTANATVFVIDRVLAPAPAATG